MGGEPLHRGGVHHAWARVAFDAELRALTARTAEDTRRMLAGGRTPPPEYAPRKCDSCSLKEVCRPQAPGGPAAVENWLAAAVAD